MNRPLRALALCGLIIAALPVACSAQPPAQPATENNSGATPSSIAPPPAATPARPLVTGLPDFSALVDRVGPAVTSISAEIAPRRVSRQQMPGQDDIPEFFRRMLPPGMLPGGPQTPQAPRGVSQGTGFLISADGYLLTNHHVVDGADKVTVRLSDRREFEAEVIGSDEQYDVALLKIDARGLPFLRAADASLTRPGQWAVAIGSPFGFDHSVTAGIVSAIGRSNPYSGQQYVPFIQSDVAINRGNSGGPLLNTSGEVIGINSQIFSNSGGFMGVSFAIPIDLAMSAAEQLKDTGSVRRGLLGVNIQQITSDEARALGLSDNAGALVSNIQPGSAAEKAGIQRMDVIRSVNGKPVSTVADLPPLIGAHAPGAKVRLGIIRDGKTRDVEVVLDALEGDAVAAANRPGPRDDDSTPAAGGNPLGLATQALSVAERQQLGLKKDEGVRVTAVEGDAVREAGIRPGDLILSIGRKTVGTPVELDRELKDAKAGDTVMLLVQRQGTTQFRAVTL